MAMSTYFETGHAKNVANFQDLLSFATGYGPSYNPANAAITLAALGAKFTSAQGRLSDVNVQRAAHTLAVNERELVFEPFSKFITRVVNAVQASAVSEEVVADVRTIARKLQGVRATPKQSPVPDDPSTPEDESTTSISSSQMSFDSRIENFDKLIQLLDAESAYAPNEAELAVAGLTTRYTAMQNANKAVVEAYTALSNARIARDKELYSATTGLVSLAADVKSYVKSLFGASSPEYQQVKSLKFTRVAK